MEFGDFVENITTHQKGVFLKREDYNIIVAIHVPRRGYLIQTWKKVFVKILKRNKFEY